MPSILEIGRWFDERGSAFVLNGCDGSIEISGPRSIEEATRTQIAFIGNKYRGNVQSKLTMSNSSCVIIDAGFSGKIDLKEISGKAVIWSEKPKEDLVAFCSQYLGFGKPSGVSLVHESACIHESSTIGSRPNVGANVVIEGNVVIGDSVIIGANTVIKANTLIGDDVEIGSCNVIGGVGFGYNQDDSGEYHQFPHFGKVILRDSVHIGNNTSIDRGSLSDTILAESVKVDNQVHIAHNVKIGRNSLIIANAMIAGSVTIGENCWVAPSSCIRNAVSIGNNVTVGLAATVTKDVADNETVMGSPAMPLADFLNLRKQQKKSLE